MTSLESEGLGTLESEGLRVAQKILNTYITWQ